MILEIDESSVRRMRRHAEAGYPLEVCGFLLGRFEEGMRLRHVQLVRPARNLWVEKAQDRYEVDPADHLAIDTEGRRLGLQIVGVYHSHPDHPSAPSETDRQRAVEIWRSAESWSYVILGVNKGRMASWRSFVLRDGRFHEEEVRLRIESIETCEGDHG